MMMAQRLYEAGYITYMRTDSTNLSADAIGMVRGFIEDEFGQKYLPGKANVYEQGGRPGSARGDPSFRRQPQADPAVRHGA